MTMIEYIDLFNTAIWSATRQKPIHKDSVFNPTNPKHQGNKYPQTEKGGKSKIEKGKKKKHYAVRRHLAIENRRNNLILVRIQRQSQSKTYNHSYSIQIITHQNPFISLKEEYITQIPPTQQLSPRSNTLRDHRFQKYQHKFTDERNIKSSSLLQMYTPTNHQFYNNPIKLHHKKVNSHIKKH